MALFLILVFIAGAIALWYLGSLGQFLIWLAARRAPVRRIPVIVRGGYESGEVNAYIAAQQVQINNEFTPAFGIRATISQNFGGWPLYLDDTSDLPGALGYHSVDPQGVSFARVFLQDCKAAGVPWQSVASHEVMEMLFNPMANRTFIGPNRRPWAGEVGDPVEDQEYFINGVPMSDFVLPRWFNPRPLVTRTAVDQRHAIAHPYEITVGGYAQFMDINGNWIQVSGPATAARKWRK